MADSDIETRGAELAPTALVGEIERTRAVFGTDDIWPYGLEPSRPTLEAFCDYMHEQRLTERLVRPEEIASAACYLLSEEAGAITGANLAVDGGLSL